MKIQIFSGFLYSARTREAGDRTSAAQEEARSLRELIARDVRTSALSAQAAFHRIEVTRQLLDQSSLALDLAQTQTEIAHANARQPAKQPWLSYAIKPVSKPLI